MNQRAIRSRLGGECVRRQDWPTSGGDYHGLPGRQEALADFSKALSDDARRALATVSLPEREKLPLDPLFPIDNHRLLD